jgi:hypothetical protein
MVFLVLAMVGELQMLHALRFSTIGNYGNFIHIDPPDFVYPSSNTFYPEGLKSFPILDVPPMQYHDAPVSTITVTGLPQENKASHDTIPVPLVPCTLLLKSPSD